MGILARLCLVVGLFLCGLGSSAHAQVYCDQSVIYDASTNGATQVIAAPGNANGRIWICSYAIYVGGTATNVGLVYGTGTNCVTNPIKITPAWQFAANNGIAENDGVFGGMLVPAGAEVCINISAGNAVQARISYRIF